MSANILRTHYLTKGHIIFSVQNSTMIRRRLKLEGKDNRIVLINFKTKLHVELIISHELKSSCFGFLISHHVPFLILMLDLSLDHTLQIFSIINEFYCSICGNGYPCFEISAVNADKPPLSVQEIKDRVKQFERVGEIY